MGASENGWGGLAFMPGPEGLNWVPQARMGTWQRCRSEMTLRGQLHACSIMFKENHFLQELVINFLSEHNFWVASNIYIYSLFKVTELASGVGPYSEQFGKKGGKSELIHPLGAEV